MVALDDEGLQNSNCGVSKTAIQLFEFPNAFQEAYILDSKGIAFVSCCVAEQEKVEINLESLGDLDERLGVREADTSLVAGHLRGMALDPAGEFPLSKASLLAESAKALTEFLGKHGGSLLCCGAALWHAGTLRGFEEVAGFRRSRLRVC